MLYDSDDNDDDDVGVHTETYVEKNINVFNEESPSKVKSNAKLSNLKDKVNKDNVNLAMLNNELEDNAKNEEEEEAGETDPAFYARLGIQDGQNLRQESDEE